jgi:general secretion pathway protein F
MARFRYSAYDGQGRLEAKEIEAVDAAAVSAALSRAGLYPFEIVPAGERGAVGLTAARRGARTPALGLSRLAGLMRELATLAGADVPLEQALTLLATGPGSGTQAAATGVLERVRGGASLSEAMSSANGAFPEYCVSMVQAGEASGTLPVVLTDLADLIERRAAMQSQLRSALVYPMILVLMALAAVVLIVSVLVPSLAPLFEDSGAEPPFAMQLLLTLHDVVVAHWPWLLAGLGVLALLVLAAVRSEPVRTLADGISLTIPVLSGLLARAETARLAHTLGALIRGGVVLPQALKIATQVVRNRTVRAAMQKISQDVKEGANLSKLLATTRVLSPMSLRLIAIGEETGRLDQMLLHVARIAETELQRRLELLMGLLTPVLTLLIGLGVGGLIYSVMTTILRVNDLAIR